MGRTTGPGPGISFPGQWQFDICFSFFSCYCEWNLWFGRWEIRALLLNTIQQSLHNLLVFFGDCISRSWPGWPWTHSVAQADAPNSVCWVAGITGLCHQAQWYLPCKKKIVVYIVVNYVYGYSGYECAHARELRAYAYVWLCVGYLGAGVVDGY